MKEVGPLLAMFRRVTLKVQKSNIFEICVQNILRMLECKLEDVNATSLPDCFIDDHLVEMFPQFHQTRLQLGNVMNPAVIHTLFSPRFGSLYRTVSRAMDRSVVLSANVTSRPVTALVNVTATEIFHRRY